MVETTGLKSMSYSDTSRYISIDPYIYIDISRQIYIDIPRSVYIDTSLDFYIYIYIYQSRHRQISIYLCRCMSRYLDINRQTYIDINRWSYIDLDMSISIGCREMQICIDCRQHSDLVNLTFLLEGKQTKNRQFPLYSTSLPIYHRPLIPRCVPCAWQIR